MGHIPVVIKSVGQIPFSRCVDERALGVRRDPGARARLGHDDHGAADHGQVGGHAGETEAAKLGHHLVIEAQRMKLL